MSDTYKSETTGGDVARAGLVGAAAASPFMGMIGQKKIINDPHTNSRLRHTSLENIQRNARVGDVILSSRPGWEGFKLTQVPLSGTEFFHASTVTGRHRGKGMVLDAGDLLPENPATRVKPADLPANSQQITKHFPAEGYGDLVHVRPDKPMSPAQQKKYMAEVAKRSTSAYSVTKGTKALLKDLFIPKLKMFEPSDPARAAARSASTLEQMCSSLPSEAGAACGIPRVAKGKSPGAVLPADYLREGSGFKVVGVHTGQRRVLTTTKQRLLRQLGIRSLIGAGLGAGIYQATEDPAVAAGAVGGLAVPAGIRALLKKRQSNQKPSSVPLSAAQRALQVQKTLPSLPAVVRTGLLADPAIPKQVEALMRRRYMTRTLPLGLAAGGGLYALTKLLTDRYKGRTKQAGEHATNGTPKLRHVVGNTLSGAFLGGGLGGAAGGVAAIVRGKRLLKSYLKMHQTYLANPPAHKTHKARKALKDLYSKYIGTQTAGRDPVSNVYRGGVVGGLLGGAAGGGYTALNDN